MTRNIWKDLLPLIMAVLLTLWLIFVERAFGQSSADNAVVRIPSHGASATVIWSNERKSYLLGCAHAYQGKDAYKKMVIDVPSSSSGQKAANGIRLVALDYRLDLSLVEMNVGGLIYLPVAPEGHKIPQRLVSIGYDNMKWPATRVWADLVGEDAIRFYTKQIPWHGRSGGALADPQGPYLVGVVQGYEMSGSRPGRGIYANHRAILYFLSKNGWSAKKRQNSNPFDLLNLEKDYPELKPGGT
jgi:hypothetical protein